MMCLFVSCSEHVCLELCGGRVVLLRLWDYCTFANDTIKGVIIGKVTLLVRMGETLFKVLKLLECTPLSNSRTC